MKKISLQQKKITTPKRIVFGSKKHWSSVEEARKNFFYRKIDIRKYNEQLKKRKKSFTGNASMYWWRFSDYFSTQLFFLLIFRMKHSIRMNEMLKSFIVHVQACVCACVVKLFPRMRTINFVPLTIHPQHSCMYSRAYTNTRPENSSWRLWCWWDPWSFKKIVCIKYTKKKHQKQQQ